jgi:hypothetical protein
MSQAARSLPVTACLSRLEGLQRAKARLEAREIEYLARLWDDPPPVPGGAARHIDARELAQLSITQEVAGALRVCYATAAGRMRDASRLVN